MKWRSLDEQTDSEKGMPLRLRLEERRAMIRQYVPAETQAVSARTIETLRQSGIAHRALAVGATAPAFTLPDQDDRAVSNSELLKTAKLVIVFFRGRWCPFCVAQLEAMNEALPAIQQAGGALVAISPQTVKQNFFMHDQHKLAFPLLSDSGNAAARQFGLAYRLPDEQKAVYQRTFVNLPFINGDSSWDLPLAATYVLHQDGRVIWRALSADYTERPEPEEIVRAICLE